jgi:hypothetical protein
LFDVFGQRGLNQIDPAPIGLTVIVLAQVVVKKIEFAVGWHGDEKNSAFSARFT